MRRRWRLSLGIVILLLACWATTATLQPAPQAGASAVPSIAAPERGLLFQDESCANPAAQLTVECRTQQEQRILASTVRIKHHAPEDTLVSHGTAVGGRYLVTHNHFDDRFLRANGVDSGTIALVRQDGKFILDRAPLASFAVAARQPETLVLDFGTQAGVGFFDLHGVRSAEVGIWNSDALVPGEVVAQVVWDGRTTAVQWARVLRHREDKAVPAIELDGPILIGVSGGGVFYNGVHIANTWIQVTYQKQGLDTGPHGTSIVALNTVEMGPNIARAMP